MKVLVIILLSVGLILLNGWVVIVMWSWYVLPLGAPDITFAHGLGIATLVSFISRAQLLDNDDQALARVVMSIVAPLATVFSGWIIHFWM